MAETLQSCILAPLDIPILAVERPEVPATHSSRALPLGHFICLHLVALLLKLLPVELAAGPGAKPLLSGSGDDHLQLLLVLCLLNCWAIR